MTNPDNLEKVLATVRAEGQNGYVADIYFARFDTTVPLRFDDAPSEHDKKCIQVFFGWQNSVFEKLQSAAFDYYKDMVEAIGDDYFDFTMATPTEIWQHCKPINLHFPASEKYPQSAFVDVELDCDWEPEHGMQWLVRDTNTVLYVGAYEGQARTDEEAGAGFGNFIEGE